MKEKNHAELTLDAFIEFLSGSLPTDLKGRFSFLVTFARVCIANAHQRSLAKIRKNKTIRLNYKLNYFLQAHNKTQRVHQAMHKRVRY